jgi:hypothetical protein
MLGLCGESGLFVGGEKEKIELVYPMSDCQSVEVEEKTLDAEVFALAVEEMQSLDGVSGSCQASADD